MLAVTTRNKLRSWRYSLPMMRARGYVREQLTATPGLISYVSAIASPTEFLTMTVWDNRQAMFDFMSSGAHQEFMWMFSRWSASFWSMRWIPTTAEEGAWDGLSLASMVKPEGQAWRAALPQAPQLLLQEQWPGRLPGGRSLDPSGCDVYAVTALVKSTNPGHIWSLLRTIRQFRRGPDHPELLRWNIGVVDSQRIWVLTLWHATSEGPSGALYALRQYLNTSWTMCWTAGEYEIGHWNHLRLRQQDSKRSRHQPMSPETIEPVGSDLS